MDWFYQNNTFIRSTNSTFTALIPKKKGAVDVKDFRPISLLDSIYQIITKLMAERLKLVIQKLVSDNQNVFVKGWQIVDVAMVANEYLEYLFNRELKGVLTN